MEIWEIEELFKNLTVSDLFDFCEISQVLLQTFSAFFSLNIFLFVGEEVVDICEEVATGRVFDGRETMDEQLNRVMNTCCSSENYL